MTCGSFERRTADLHKLNPVTERIVDEEPPHARETVIRSWLISCVPTPSRNSIQIVNVKGDVRFPGRTEFSFDSQMQLCTTQVKPRAAASGVAAGFGYFVQPEDIAVEAPRLVLSTARHGDLHVVDP
jgi:hypothetical protein